MKYFSETINYLTATAAVLFIISLFVGNRRFDLHFHDTYYVIPVRQYFILLSFLLLAIWTIYKLMDGFLYSTTLTRVQVIATVVAVLILALAPVITNRLYTPGDRSLVIPKDPALVKDYMAQLRRFEKTFQATVLLFIAAQLTLLVNIVIGIIKRN